MSGKCVRKFMFYMFCLMVCTALGACAKVGVREEIEVAHAKDILSDNQNEEDAFLTTYGGTAELPYTSLACGAVAPMPKGIALELCVNS